MSQAPGRGQGGVCSPDSLCCLQLALWYVWNLDQDPRPGHTEQLFFPGHGRWLGCRAVFKAGAPQAAYGYLSLMILVILTFLVSVGRARAWRSGDPEPSSEAAISCGLTTIHSLPARVCGLGRVSQAQSSPAFAVLFC